MTYDVIVSGAGPAGCTCALFLARQGTKVLLLEKAKFPRDKVCADNKTWLCLDIVKELGLWDEFEKLEKAPIKGVLVASPSGHEFYTPLLETYIEAKGPWYNMRRELFDNMLAQACKKEKNIELIEDAAVLEPLLENSSVVGVKFRSEDNLLEARAKVVVVADGSASHLANALGHNTRLAGRYALNARAYFTNVKGPMDRCELYYLKGICPGYFWIFPVDENTCNVGIGMRYEDIRGREASLKQKFDEMLKSEKFRERFSGAQRVGDFGFWGLSVLGKRTPCSGAGYVLCGDAGTFAMTFSGEGVGPAMRTGKIASESIAKAFERNDFSARSMKEYDEMLWSVLEPEVKGFRFLETLILNEWLFDFVAKRAAKKPELILMSSRMQMDYKRAQDFFKLSTIRKLLF